MSDTYWVCDGCRAVFVEKPGYLLTYDAKGNEIRMYGLDCPLCGSSRIVIYGDPPRKEAP